ncbi:uncharacterized protein YijF (DUF1287 family) [Clostridiales Family XIII bacterium PM5-7]
MGNKRKKKITKIRPRFFLILGVIAVIICGSLFVLLGKEDHQETNHSAQREQGYQIMFAARKYILNPKLRYDPAYFSGGYPPDELGVCTDVVWKGFLGIDVSLKDLVDEDIERNQKAYANVLSVPDPNIDFRYVPTLERFFERKAEVLTTDVNNILAWQPGDIVTFESSHVAIVSDFVIFGGCHISFNMVRIQRQKRTVFLHQTEWRFLVTLDGQ